VRVASPSTCGTCQMMRFSDYPAKPLYQSNLRCFDSKIMASKRELKREAKARNAMLRRTCNECGHSWVLPSSLASAGRKASVGSALTGNTAAGTAISQRVVEFERCIKCGSVRYFREAPLEDPSQTRGSE
jgi:predicted nucleic-acid-binding Zn-ribbon protein